MIIKIHQACSTKNALFYNERKADRHWASFYHSQNMPVINPFLGDKNDRYRIFQEIEDRNTRVKKKGLHISVNPTVGDLVRLGDIGFSVEIDNLMKHLGYENQPYLVYKHTDLERIHFHVVSTRIDCDTGKKIKDNFEKEKTQRFIKGLEEKYQLTKDDLKERMNFRFSDSSKKLKQNLESLFCQLNQMEFITSKERYDQALGLFQVEIRKAGRGHLVFVTDENGKTIRHPIRMSDFSEKPQFYSDHTHHLKNDKRDKIMHPLPIEQRDWEMNNFKNRFIRELIRQVDYSRWDANQRLPKKKDLRKKKGKRY